VSNLSDTEIEVLAAAKQLLDQGVPEVYGYLLAKTIEDQRKAAGRRGFFGWGTTIGDGTLYLALDQLVKKGLLMRREEEKVTAEAEGRPRRYYYRLVDPSRLPEETR
jgi:DNA-binding PadR family transcriptional regulator